MLDWALMFFVLLGEQTLQLRPGSIGIGIGGIRERARELGGELRILKGNPGTLVEVVIPAKIPSRDTTLATI